MSLDKGDVDFIDPRELKLSVFSYSLHYYSPVMSKTVTGCLSPLKGPSIISVKFLGKNNKKKKKWNISVYQRHEDSLRSGIPELKPGHKEDTV